MPCGGIYPITFGDFYVRGECWHCGKSNPVLSHYCEEWDAFLHSECIDPFLKTKEGDIVLQHGHEVIR